MFLNYKKFYKNPSYTEIQTNKNHKVIYYTNRTIINMILEGGVDILQIFHKYSTYTIIASKNSLIAYISYVEMKILFLA